MALGDGFHRRLIAEDLTTRRRPPPSGHTYDHAGEGTSARALEPRHPELAKFKPGLNLPNDSACGRPTDGMGTVLPTWSREGR